MVDGTKSFQKSYYETEKDFKKIRRFIKSFVRDLDDDRFRVGMMQYTDKGTAKKEIDFLNPKNDFAEIKIRLSTIVQQRGYKRFTGDALAQANKQVGTTQAFCFISFSTSFASYSVI